MYLNILKKDLKRKRTMNIILLIFVILAVMFVSSSVNNLVAVTTALDGYFEKANVPDYFVATKGTAEKGKSTVEIIKGLDYVSEYKTEKCYYTNDQGIEYKGEKKSYGSNGVICSLDKSYTKYFDSNNNEITEINEGEIYLNKNLLSKLDISVGDKINIVVADVSVEFKIVGIIKDALFGSAMMGSPRFVMNQNDFDKYDSSESTKPYEGELILISTSNIDALKQEVSHDPTIVFDGSKSLFKTTYIMDMIIAGVLLILSIFLIIIAFVILRFTIKFTLSEEFREIGVMKAIGIRNIKIRGIYIVKYLAIALVGTIIGFICGIPFSSMLLTQVSDNIVIADENGILISIAAAILVLLIIVLFSYSCTSKVKKFTPIDAIRNGQTGERYNRKGIIRLSKTHLRPIPFMAVNDILSGLKRFLIVMATFMISILLVTVILNVMSTLQSGKLVSWFSMTESDVYIGDSDTEKCIRPDGHEMLKQELNKIEQNLSDNGIEAKCAIETIFRFTVSKGDKSYNSLAFQGTGTTPDEYEYMSGTAPQNVNEIGLTYIVADSIGAEIGDTVEISTANGTDEYLVTAIFQSMNNMGQGIRLHQDVDLDYSLAMGTFGYQINYTDNPTESQETERLEKIKELYPDCKVYTGGEYVDNMVGGIAGYMSSVVYLSLLIVIIINILVAVLMEKSFFTKERSEIAMLKAIGFTNRAIITRQTLRMAIVMVAAAIFAILVAEPVGQLAVGGIFRIMGAKTIIFDVNVLYNYVICPLVVLVCTIISVIIVDQQVRGVSSSEINNME